MIVRTGDVLSSVGFYKSRGYEYSHRIENFITDNYDHQMIEDGVLLKDMIYLNQDFMSMSYSKCFSERSSTSKAIRFRL